VWRAFLVALLTTVLTLTHNFELALVLFIGGSVAFTYSLTLVLYAGWLDEKRVARIEPWRGMDPNERPSGKGGRRWAFNHMTELVLRFAKATSGIAIALLATALLAAYHQ